MKFLNLKALLVIKVIFLCMIFFGKGFYIGDRPLDAQENTPTTPPEENNQKLAQNDDSEEVVVKRKSYLDDLLSLPKIDTSNLKKSEISRYLNILDRKNRQIEERVELLSRREKNLVKLEKSIDTKIDKLQEEMDFFNQTIQKEKEINQKRLDSLVEFYQKMTPKKAAPVFEQMDKDLVVSLFNRIPKKQTMNILSLMNPEKSVELTEYFGRIKSGKEYEMLKEINSALKKEFQQCKGMPEN